MVNLLTEGIDSFSNGPRQTKGSSIAGRMTSLHEEHVSFVRVRVIRDQPLQGLPLGSHRRLLQLCTEDAPAFDPERCTRLHARDDSFSGDCGSREFIHARSGPLLPALHTRQWDTSFRWISRSPSLFHAIYGSF